MQRKNDEIINKIIEYVDKCYFKDNYTPSVREIAEKIGISKSSVSNYLQYMNNNNLISSRDGYRNIQTKKIDKSNTGAYLVPVVGEVACGIPLLAEQNIECYMSLPKELFKQGNYFILKAHGKSMIKAGIDDGDLVIVKQQSTAENGSIVVALCNDDECTLKRIYKENKKIRLHPENDSMKDMIYDNVKVQGIAVNVIKKIS